MAERLASYTGNFHLLKGRAVDVWHAFQENLSSQGGGLHGIKSRTSEKITGLKEKAISSLNKGNEGDYSHVYRRKSRAELVRVSAAVMGIEFAYAAETAFVSPTLLGIGIQHRNMTLIWCLSPMIGFFLTPLLGSFSDRCKSRLGRRRPFIILLSIGIILGLLLVPNGKYFGQLMGDVYPEEEFFEKISTNVNTTAVPDEADVINEVVDTSSHPWGIFLTVLGTVLLDFDADACQSPSRAYLLDVCIPEDHALGLSTFTIMAGLGGSLGYAMGGINWDNTFIGVMLGGHVRAVFTLVTFIFIACVIVTLYSFSEIPLNVLSDSSNVESINERRMLDGEKYGKFEEDLEASKTYGTMEENYPYQPNHMGVDNPGFQESSFTEHPNNQNEFQDPAEINQLETQPLPHGGEISLREYVTSIIYMPKSMRILCLTNLFCWMSLVCYSLYFTDFVGEAVFGGNPKAPVGSPEREIYEEGVRFACWGMAMYSLSCSCYSFIIERLVKRFRARQVYMGGQLVYTFGMILMALTRSPAGVIIFSWTAGVMYSTLFTMPYLLVAHYHASQVFAEDASGTRQCSTSVRGLGTDVALVSSMVFLAQFILSSSMGSIISAAGSTTAVIVSAAVLSFCGSMTASQVMYLDL
ncbi:proton-associated sugar transporter A-like [Daphnia carinata]|uniref:proton-associated sugar transporter A-like n=1 Tax=Daphnia carinata TaxID=120202 RepID=UPI00257A461D|nr:proton-associated sugar transporter A-like [Daphnia carinata]